MYEGGLCLTQQFRFCGNPFKIDLYKGCDFGCKYCFANRRSGAYKNNFDIIDFNRIKRIFYNALETDKDFKDINIELIRKRVPLHCGGMSDPFQTRELELGLTKELIKLTNDYQYPVMFSTKVAYLPEDYYAYLNNKYHSFQISVIGYNDSFIRKYESNTPLFHERLDFIKQLKSRDFWVSCRLQPIIDINEDILVCKDINGLVDYVTMEHLKIPVQDAKLELYDDIDKTDYKRRSTMSFYELNKDIKKANILTLSKYLDKTLYGVGDNDLHYMSQTNCCCGIDTVNNNFKNWLKYNLTNLSKMPNCEYGFIPNSKVANIFNSSTVLIDEEGNRVDDYKTYVDNYIVKHLDFFDENSLAYDYFSSVEMPIFKHRERKR